ncbi:transcription factor TFIIIB component B'' homolog [Arapaima gigas]
MGEAPNNEMREPSCEAAAFEKKKATKLHTEEGRAVFTPSDTSEAQFTHQEPTIILTLIQIPTSPVDGYESSCVPVSTVTAELLSPVVFVDAQSECQSRDPLTAAEVHVTGGCSSISDFMVNNPLEEHGGGVGPTITREKCGAERSRNLCEEEDISLSLEELGHSLDAGSKDAGADAAPPLKKRTSPPIKTSRARQRNSFSKEEDIPQSLTLEESVDSLDVGSEESSVGTVPPLKKRRLSIETRTGSSKNVPANPSKEESMDPGDEPTPSVPVSMLFKDNNPTAVAIYTQQCPTEALVTAAQELSQGIVGHDDLLKQDTGAAVAVEILDSSGEKEPEPNHQITPLASDGPLTRPGRKPRGFLSFISNKTGPGCASTARTGRLTSQRPLVNTARAERRKTSLVAPTETVTNSPATKDVCSNVTVGLSRGRQTHELASSPVSTSPQSQASCVKPTGSKGNGKEPTNVTEYIFSDIFTEVEERDGHQL